MFALRNPLRTAVSEGSHELRTIIYFLVDRHVAQGNVSRRHRPPRRGNPRSTGPSRFVEGHKVQLVAIYKGREMAIGLSNQIFS